MKKYLKKPFKLSTIMLIFITMFLYLIIILVGKFNITTLICGSLLLTTTSMISFTDGYRGVFISILLAITGLGISVYNYFHNLNPLSITPSIIALSTVISCVFIGHSSERIQKENSDLAISLITDSMTGLYNNKYFYSVLDKLVSDASAAQVISLVLIDIDNFTDLNKAYGFEITDRVLADVSKIIKSHLIPGQQLFKYSGDKFALILPELLLSKSYSFVQSISYKVGAYTLDLDGDYRIENLNISTGIANYPESVDHINEVYHQASKNLKDSKHFNRTNVTLYRNLFQNICSIMKNDEDIEKHIRMFLNVIDSKDNYTIAHSERVLKYMLNFGRLLNFDHDIIEKIKIISLLHDVGKMDIPAGILNKPEGLTFQEYSIVKKHANIGFDIIQCLPNLEEYAYIVKHHHERYDGQGYPNGLKGEKIPYFSRMLALADSFDAMLSNRPYQQGMSLKEAIKEIKSNSGTQFDPDLVEEFINSVELMQSSSFTLQPLNLIAFEQ